ncbi:MAG: hypothetical protein HKP21_04145 [Xanthomonadales bacterium]|nr:hypothetical protein [Gammaproteobacteria bacterium]NNK03722.1 hypothetical protein [Xanthomonadales bacterium]
MKKSCALGALILSCLLSQTLAANQTTLSELWERDSAMAAVRSVDIATAVFELGDISSLADGESTLKNLRNLETRSDWPLPAREAALYQFTRSLADLPRDVVATEVMEHLRNYQAQALVPHEDHRGARVPLFNIRGAAAGVENVWQRAEFAIEAAELLESNPVVMVSNFAASNNRNQQAAYLETLESAGIENVLTVQSIATDRLADLPSLTPMVGEAAAITGDIFTIEQLLLNGRGSGLSSAFAGVESRLSATDLSELLSFAVEQTPAENAALAMAAWWPRLKHNAVSRDLLLATLADPNLGASAALALAREPDIQTIKALQDTAAGDSDAARRAQMALDLNRARLAGEVNQ